MLNQKKLFALALLLAATLSASITKASEQALATISNDESKNTYQLVIDSTDGNRAIKTFYKDIFLGGRKISREALDYRVLVRTGIILEQRDKYIVMRLKSNNFDEEQGGVITVDTLFNGANGTRKAYEISLAKDKAGWELMSQGKVIKQIYIQTNKVKFLGSVGIKNLVMK
jgi:hypothetical protein